ncbi:hypothetical protein [Duganella sp. Dugasp56]|uniref:hypothetical protein n=1 Tax=Duganella sp. Dugasp56 TaxID=3243046 RepID=UPI0039AF4201
MSSTLIEQVVSNAVVVTTTTTLKCSATETGGGADGPRSRARQVGVQTFSNLVQSNDELIKPAQDMRKKLISQLIERIQTRKLRAVVWTPQSAKKARMTRLHFIGV